jgi:hypothetical protein
MLKILLFLILKVSSELNFNVSYSNLRWYRHLLYCFYCHKSIIIFRENVERIGFFFKKHLYIFLIKHFLICQNVNINVSKYKIRV